MANKKRVLITRKIPKLAIDFLKKHYQVKVYSENKAIPKEILNKEAKKADAIITLLTEKIDKNFLKNNSHLKIIANYAVGFDNIDIKEATKYNTVITNTPHVSTVSVAEFTLALLLSITKRIFEADEYTKKGKYKVWQPMLLLGSELHTKTIGIIGAGRIGSDVALKCYHAFGMKVLYYDHGTNETLEIATNAKKVTLKHLLKESDFISLHVPLNDATKHLIGKEEFKLMKKDAYLINTARGAVVDEKELLKTLKQNRIKGAAIDVFEFEPKITKGLNKLDNLIMTPHIASSTREARERMAMIAAKNVHQVLQNKKAEDIVNDELYCDI